MKKNTLCDKMLAHPTIKEEKLFVVTYFTDFMKIAAKLFSF